VLDPTIHTRIKELGRGTFSLHAIETVCFNRQIRRNHAVTGQFARDTPALQDAIDPFITANYRPGMERNGGTARNARRCSGKSRRQSARWRFTRMCPPP
jgi:hypothetical protein